MPTPVGATEIAELLGVQRPAIERAQQRGGFPEPRWPSVGGRPAWDLHLDVMPWAHGTGRITPARPLYVALHKVRQEAARWETLAKRMLEDHEVHGASDQTVYEFSGPSGYRRVGPVEQHGHLVGQTGYVAVGHRQGGYRELARRLAGGRSIRRMEALITAAVETAPRIAAILVERRVDGMLDWDTDESPTDAGMRLVLDAANELVAQPHPPTEHVSGEWIVGMVFPDVAGVEAGWRRNFRLRDLGGDRVLLEARDDGDTWEPIASFVGDQEGGYQAFPERWLRESSAEHAERIAWEHLRTWERMCTCWGRTRPGEPVPTWLVPQRYA